MVTAPLRVLLVEDNPGDARLLREILAEGEVPNVDLVHVETLKEAEAALDGDGADGGEASTAFGAVLLDLGLPDGSGLDTVNRVQAVAPRIPVVVLTGTDDDELAVEAVRQGAQDYIVKGEVTGRELARYLRHAQERLRLLEREREARLEAEEGFRQAEEATRKRDEVLRMVVHDLRSPLSGIRMGAGAALREGSFLAPETARVVSAIRREADRMSRLLQDLLDAATVEGGHTGLRRQPCRVPPLVEEVTELLQPALDEQAISFEREVPEDLPLILADRDRLAQVLSNLLSNAVKFTPAEGTVAVGATVDGERGVRISVGDTGPGMPEEERARLFDRFWDPARHRKGKRSGTGLGLVIARGIVEAHEGRIWAESEQGKGSTFHFTVPTAGEREE